MNRQEIIDEILHLLAILESHIKKANRLNHLDINLNAENFFRDFLNLLYGFNLRNMNVVAANNEVIDLVNETGTLCIQVTSDNSFKKIKETVNAYIEKKLYENNGKLVIFLTIPKINYRKKILTNAEYTFDILKDIWDISKIEKDINDFELDKLNQVLDFLRDEIQRKEKTQQTRANEVNTFVELITALSNEKNPLVGKGYLEEPDPEGKVHHRFKDHQEYLIETYTQLHEEYGEVLKLLYEQLDLGPVRIRRLGFYLRSLSDKILTEKNGNPREALENLVEILQMQLSEQRIKYDLTAIRFFLIDQLIKCNVFPNKEP